MGIHRQRAHHQRFGNLGILQSLRHQPQHLDFTLSQGVKF